MHRLKQHTYHGQSAVEISLIMALVAAIALVGLNLTGTSLNDVFCRVAGTFGGSCGVLFSDDFADLDAWTRFMPGNDPWKIRDGQLCTGNNGGQIFRPSVGADDYVINVDLARLTAGNGYGVFFRSTNLVQKPGTSTSSVNGYTFQYDPGMRGFVFRKWVNGNEMLLQPRLTLPNDYNYYDVDRQVQVSVIRDQFVASIDGQPVLTVSDSTYPTGGIGLRSWYGSQACFDDLSVHPTR